MKTALFLCLFLYTGMFAQYTKDTKDLGEAVYSRSYNKELFSSYFTSTKPERVRAGIFAIAQLADTNLFQNIPEALYKDYAPEIAFAAGMCGKSEATKTAASQFVYSKKLYAESFLIALARTGGIKDLNAMIAAVKEKVIPDTAAVGLAAFTFSQNRVSSSEAVTLCAEIVKNENLPLRRRAEAAFFLFRTGSNAGLKEYILALFAGSSSIKPDGETINFYGLLTAVLRREKAVGNPVVLTEMYNNTSDVFLKTEILKLLFSKPVFSTEEFKNLAGFCKDPNGNCAYNAAQLLATAGFPDSTVVPAAVNEIAELLPGVEDSYVRGEMYCSMISLARNKAELLEKYSSLVDPGYYIRCVNRYFTSNQVYFKLIQEQYSKAPLIDKLQTGDYFIKVLGVANLKEKATEFLLGELFSANPAIAGNIAENLDSNFVIENASKISGRLTVILPQRMNDPDFLETVFSYIKMFPYLQPATAEKLKSTLLNSEIASVRAKINGSKPESPFNKANFSMFFKNAFSFSGAVIKTTKGDITIRFKPEVAPISTGNFIALVRQGFYNDVRFHRVVPGFVIQAGDPKYEGWGGPGYDIPSEYSGEQYRRGVMGMASAGRDTEGSQWFIMQGDHHHLNGRYSVFAEVEKGYSAVEKITMNDRILSVELIR